MQKAKTIFLVAVLIGLISSCAVFAQKQNKGKKSKLMVVGTIVAYDQLLPLVNLTTVPASQFLIIRIDETIKGQETAKYIGVVYQSDKLPENILDGTKQSQFVLKRNSDCGNFTKENPKTASGDELQVDRVKRIPGAENENIPSLSDLPCYILHPGNLTTK